MSENTNDCIDDFQEGQWWLAELDSVVKNGTDDQKRSVAVVRNLLKTAHSEIDALKEQARVMREALEAIAEPYSKHPAFLEGCANNMSMDRIYEEIAQEALAQGEQG